MSGWQARRPAQARLCDCVARLCYGWAAKGSACRHCRAPAAAPKQFFWTPTVMFPLCSARAAAGPELWLGAASRPNPNLANSCLLPIATASLAARRTLAYGSHRRFPGAATPRQGLACGAGCRLCLSGPWHCCPLGARGGCASAQRAHAIRAQDRAARASVPFIDVNNQHSLRFEAISCDNGRGALGTEPPWDCSPRDSPALLGAPGSCVLHSNA